MIKGYEIHSGQTELLDKDALDMEMLYGIMVIKDV